MVGRNKYAIEATNQPGRQITIHDNLHLTKWNSVAFYNEATAFLPEALRTWSIARNYSPGDPRSGSQYLPLGSQQSRQDIRVLSENPLDRNYLRVDPTSITIPDGDPFPGALPPGPAPADGDWFTRLQDCYRAAQADIPRLKPSDSPIAQ